MSDYKLGDRVRLTIEGPITWTAKVNGDIFDIANIVTVNVSNPKDFKDAVYSVELIVDVPTKPGALVYPCDDSSDWTLYVLSADGQWRTPYGGLRTEEQVSDALRGGTYYVAFDGVDG